MAKQKVLGEYILPAGYDEWHPEVNTLELHDDGKEPPFIEGTGVPPNKDARRMIIREFREIQKFSGWNMRDIFRDWIDLTKGYLDMLPTHVQSAVDTGQMAKDTPEVQAVFEQKRRRYDRKGDEKYWQRAYGHFAKATQLLIDSTEWGYRDIIGELFEDEEIWLVNEARGQYFTPWNLCMMMAHMQIGENDQDLYDRLRAAIEKSSVWGLIQAMGGDRVMHKPEVVKGTLMMWPEQILVHYEPITVCDCACGSGRMLLAAAACYPQWASRMGLIQFYGQDIDETAYKMASINMMIYGLNGYNAKLMMPFLSDEAQAKLAERRAEQAAAAELRLEELRKEEEARALQAAVEAAPMLALVDPEMALEFAPIAPEEPEWKVARTAPRSSPRTPKEKPVVENGRTFVKARSGEVVVMPMMDLGE